MSVGIPSSSNAPLDPIVSGIPPSTVSVERKKIKDTASIIPAGSLFSTAISSLESKRFRPLNLRAIMDRGSLNTNTKLAWLITILTLGIWARVRSGRLSKASVIAEKAKTKEDFNKAITEAGSDTLKGRFHVLKGQFILQSDPDNLTKEILEEALKEFTTAEELMGPTREVSLLIGQTNALLIEQTKSKTEQQNYLNDAVENFEAAIYQSDDSASMEIQDEMFRHPALQARAVLNHMTSVVGLNLSQQRTLMPSIVRALTATDNIYKHKMADEVGFFLLRTGPTLDILVLPFSDSGYSALRPPEGSFGKVYRAKILASINLQTKRLNRTAQRTFKAMKISHQKLNKEEIESVAKEGEELAKINPRKERGLQSPPSHIVRDLTFERSVILGRQGGKIGALLVSDLAEEGDLADWLAKGQSGLARLDVCRQLIAAFKLMRDKKIMHGDLKPPNILCFQREGKVSIDIADFGALRYEDNPFGGYEDNPFGGFEDITGTPGYTAPEDEDIQHKLRQEYAALQKANASEDITQREILKSRLKKALIQQDTFAMGVTLYQMLANGAHPYPSFQRPSFKIRPGDQFDQNLLRRINVNEHLIQLLKEMTDQDPAKRPEIDEHFFERCSKIFGRLQ